MAKANKKIDMMRNSSTVDSTSNSSLSVSRAGATIVEAMGAMNAYMAIRTVDVHRRCAGQLLHVYKFGLIVSGFVISILLLKKVGN